MHKGADPLSITTRSARPADFDRIRQICLAAFKEDEANMWTYLAAHEPRLGDGDVLLALAGDLPVAVTVLVRRRIRSRTGWVSGAIVTLVACDPAYQGKGYGSAVVKAANERMRAEGIALGILYGERDYYPRFGYVPMLPPNRVEVGTKILTALGEGDLRPVKPADLPALTALYADAYHRHPCAVERDATPWLWTVRVPERNALLTLPEPTAYAVVSPVDDRLQVTEAAAADPAAARRLLAALGHEAARQGKEQVWVGVPPEHLLARVARLLECRQVRSSAIFGMVVVTNWDGVLPPGYTVTPEGLTLDGRLVLHASHRLITQLALGYLSADDLAVAEGVSFTGSPADRERLALDFPAAFPKWSLDPLW